MFILETPADWNFIRNPKERKLVKLSIALGILPDFLALLFVTPLIAEYLSMPADVYNLLVRSLNTISQRAAMIGVVFAMVWYIAAKLMKICREKNRLPSTLNSFAKIARLYHAPAAILAFGFALIHAYIFHVAAAHMMRKVHLLAIGWQKVRFLFSFCILSSL